MNSIGFLVNPIAGLGGRVGLKGTDGLAEEAIARGAQPLAGERARQALKKITDSHALFVTCSGDMGEEVIKNFHLEYKVMYDYRGPSNACDTRKACKRFLEEGVELILFAGGDGTARDVCSVVLDRIPVLGIPAGVKMHSSVFALNPEACGNLLSSYLKGEAETIDAEVIDVDEEAYRDNRLETKLYCLAKTPYKKNLVQASKSSLHAATDEHAKEDIAKFAAHFMDDGNLYLLGAGSTTKAISEELGVDKTLLGVDAIKNRMLVRKDVSESDILSLIKKEETVKAVVSPTGKQGFLFGRGNQQFSPNVLKKVGIGNIIVVATPQKLVETPVLHVDTGDPKLDRTFGKKIRVVCGWKLAAWVKIG